MDGTNDKKFKDHLKDPEQISKTIWTVIGTLIGALVMGIFKLGFDKPLPPQPIQIVVPPSPSHVDKKEHIQPDPLVCYDKNPPIDCLWRER